MATGITREISLPYIRPARTKREADKAFALATEVFAQESSPNDWLSRKSRLWNDDPAYAHRNLIVSVDDSNSIVGLVRIVPRVMRRSGQRIKMAGISSVCVSPSRRGEGLSTLLVSRALAIAQSRGFDLAVLIARRSADHFYGKFGFWGISAYSHLKISRTQLDSGLRCGKSRPAKVGDIDILAASYDRCYQGSFGSSYRDRLSWRALLRRFDKVDGPRWAVVEAKQRVAGYALADAERIYELAWAKDADPLAVLRTLLGPIRAVRRTPDVELRLPSGHEFFGRVSNLDISMVHRECPFGGHMVKILNRGRVLGMLRQRLERSMKALEIADYCERAADITIVAKDGVCIPKLNRPDTADLDFPTTCRLLGARVLTVAPLRLDQSIPFSIGLADEI